MHWCSQITFLCFRYFNRWKERNQIHFSFEGGRFDSSAHGGGLGKKRIKLATDTAATVVHEQFYVRDSHVYNSIVTSSLSDVTLKDIEPAAAETAISLKRSHDAAHLCSVEGGQKVIPLTGLRRRNIILQVPMYYSCRMQKSTHAHLKAYYFPRVEQVESKLSEIAAESKAVDSHDLLDESAADFISDHLQPLVARPALIVGDNAVPVVSSWLCCVSIATKL